jgi:putative nucleotidyltransferase with HDIG domain
MKTNISNASIIDRVVDCVEQLPALPVHIQELRRVTANPDVTFKQVIPILNTDPGLTAALLKLVNSARYGLRERIGTVEQAMLFFGMQHFIEYVAIAFAEKTLKRAFAKSLDINAYFEHATEVSLLTRQIAEMAGLHRQEQETLTMAGLLHDVGRLVLELVTQVEGVRLLRDKPAEEMEAIILNEQEKWGIDHCEIGSRICHKWRFPEVFESCIRWHHRPVHGDSFDAGSAIIFLAHILTVPGIGAEAIATALPPARLDELHLTPEGLASLAPEEDANPV